MRLRILILILILIIIILGGLGFLISKKEQRETILKSEVAPSSKLSLRSPAFENQGFIPSKYTCDGQDINPPLLIENVPQGTKSLALVMEDPDAPGRTFLHWLLWNIDPQIKKIEEGKIPEGAIQGKNDFGKKRYGGPCPPSGTHRYIFTLYALSAKLDFPEDISASDFKTLIRSHIIDQAQLIGLYKRE